MEGTWKGHFLCPEQRKLPDPGYNWARGRYRIETGWYRIQFEDLVTRDSYDIRSPCSVWLSISHINILFNLVNEIFKCQWHRVRVSTKVIAMLWFSYRQKLIFILPISSVVNMIRGQGIGLLENSEQILRNQLLIPWYANGCLLLLWLYFNV